MKEKAARIIPAAVIAAFTAFLACAPAALASTPLLVGQTGTIGDIQASDSPADGASAYKSSNSKVVSVNSAGTFKARRTGSATLTSTGTNGSKKSTSFTVYAQDSSKSNKPKATSGLTATQNNETSVSLAWKKAGAASGYAVYQKAGSTYVPIRLVEGSDTTSCTMGGFSPNTSATFAVCAYEKVAVNAKRGKRAVKETRLALSAKSVSVSCLLEDEQSTLANAAGVAFERNQITIVGKGTAEATAHAVSSSDTLPVLSKKLRYSSSNPKVATVDDNGTVRSHSGKPASCTITVAAHNGLKASIKVHVIDKLTSKSATFIAHRGDMQAAPENTTAAVVMAARNGYSSFEFDVWETYCGDLVVSHDQSLKRMCGIDKDVRELNAKDMGSSDYYGNYRITAGGNLEQYRKLTISTFEELIRLAARFGIDTIVHVKNPESDPLSQAGMDKILKTLDLYGMTDRTAFTCSTTSTAKKLIATGFPTCYSISSGLDYDVHSSDYMSALKLSAQNAAEAGFSQVSLKYNGKAPFGADFIDYCHDLGLKVDTWGVTTVKRACLLIDMGVDSLTLDKKLFS